MVRAFKIAGYTLAGLAALLVVAAAALWWWAGTQSSLDWTLERIARSQTMTAEGVQGSLRTGLQAKRLEWRKDDVRVEVFDAHLAWQPLALLRSTVKIDFLRAGRLRIEDKRPPKPSSPPKLLELPLRVEVDDVKVGQVQWITTADGVEVGDVAGSYAFNRLLQHEVRVASLRWAGGSYSGQATIGGRDPLPVDAQIQARFETAVPGSPNRIPLVLTATLKGPMADMQARAELKGPPDGAQATATARVAPWATQPLPHAHAEFTQLDLRALWPQAPRTVLAGKIDVRPAGKEAWLLTAEAGNSKPGPWDQEMLPVERFNASGEWRGGQALVRTLRARVGGGDVQAQGAWRGADGWSVEGTLAGIDPSALYSGLAPVPIGGRADLEGEGRVISFDIDLKAQGAARRGKAKRSEVGAAIEALELRAMTARGRWDGTLLSLPQFDVRASDATLRVAADLQPRAGSARGKAELDAPGLQVRLDGNLSETAGAGALRASSANLAQALGWLSRLPYMPRAIAGSASGGRGELQASWKGGWRDPAVQANLSVPTLDLRADAVPPGATPLAAWTIRDVTVMVNGRLADAVLQAQGRAEKGQRRVSLDMAGRAGGQARAGAPWRGQLAKLQLVLSDPATGEGNWTAALQRGVDWRFVQGKEFEASAGQAVLSAPRRPQAEAPATLVWDPVRWRLGELHTSGRLTGLPLGWIEFIGGAQLAGSALGGDMVFDGQWEASLGAVPRIRASLARSRGDVTVLAEAAGGGSARVAAGVREARIAIESQGEAVTATLRWDSERGGNADGRLATRMARGGAAGWEWPAGAPLSGSLKAQLPRIGVWSLLAPPGWRLRGSLAADIAIAGTRSNPRLQGTLGADDLGLRSVVDGIELQGGRLRARFDGTRLLVDEFRLSGPGTAGGTLSATGEGSWAASGLQAQMTAQVVRLRASIRSDRQLTVSGTVRARRDAAGTVVGGNLRVDQALIVLPEEDTPKLGDDVVVRGAAGPILKAETKVAAPADKPSQQLAVEIEIDLGDNFRVQGLGIDTRLRGTLALSGRSVTQPRLTGTIRAVGGEYRAYGQRLDIERGIVRFTGAYDNPSLDILAIRPNLIQRVGVQVTGQALAPFVRLYSEPDLPEVEKLSWLVTGRAAPATGAESALVQQAAIALLASRSGSGKRGIASALGLDELSFKRAGSEGPSVTLGKRFGRDFYAAYERSISGALGTLYIFYDLTRRVTVRAEAGERTAVDLILTFSFD